MGEVRRRIRPTVRLTAEIATLALAVHLVLPQLAGLRAIGEALANATWWLPLTVIVLEAASLAAYGELMVLALRRAGESVSRGFAQRTVVVGLSLGRTLPGGTTTALAMITAAFRRRGVDPARAATAMAASGGLSTVTLAALLPIASLFALATGHVGGIALSATIAAVTVVVVASFAPLVLRNPQALADLAARLARFVARGPLRRRINPDTVRDTVLRGVDGARALASDRPTLLRAVGWATANWLLDIAVVYVLAMTLGRGVPLAAIPLAYVIAQVSASVPITPGGVGVVETAMIAALVASGAPGGAATATVLGWRLISHWLPIIVGLALAPTLRGGSPAATATAEATAAADRADVVDAIDSSGAVDTADTSGAGDT